MILVLQRVSSARVEVPAQGYAEGIERGLLILAGVEQGDGPGEAEWCARKAAHLRIFEDQAGKMNLSVKDVGGAALVVSQFTLAADCRKGNRPSFIQAAPPEAAQALYEHFCRILATEHAVAVKKGIFQAEMAVHLVNQGPVTIILRKPPGEETAG